MPAVVVPADVAVASGDDAPVIFRFFNRKTAQPPSQLYRSALSRIMRGFESRVTLLAETVTLKAPPPLREKHPAALNGGPSRNQKVDK